MKYFALVATLLPLGCSSAQTKKMAQCAQTIATDSDAVSYLQKACPQLFTK